MVTGFLELYKNKIIFDSFSVNLSLTFSSINSLEFKFSLYLPILNSDF